MVAIATVGSAMHALPPLPYARDALEPHVDARTMTLHHDVHHASYIEILNAALAGQPDLRRRSAVWLLLNLRRVPKEIRTAVRNSAGGHVNHSQFWRAMAPAAGGAPAGPLAAAIDRDFGGFESFRAQFEEAGGKRFGSGWVWLARARLEGGGLRIVTTAGHDNPLMQGHFPILVNDLWEHAYYLKHENRRDSYLKGWWPVVNWAEAARRFERSDLSIDGRWDDEGGQMGKREAPAPKEQFPARIPLHAAARRRG